MKRKAVSRWGIIYMKNMNSLKYIIIQQVLFTDKVFTRPKR